MAHVLPNALANRIGVGNVSFETLQEAFGPDSLGILVVKDVPEQFPKLRQSALSYASYLGNLPQAELGKLNYRLHQLNTGVDNASRTDHPT